MKAMIFWQEGKETVELPDDESGFYHGVAGYLTGIQIPNYLTVVTTTGQAEFEIRERGSWYENGVAHPSMYVVEKVNTIGGLSDSVYPHLFLVCVNPESKGGEGAYKKYEITQTSPHEILCEWGPMDGHRGNPGSVSYPSRLFWIRKVEKLSKGYTDRTAQFCGKKLGTTNTSPATESTPMLFSDDESGRLYETLLSWAKEHCRENLRCGVDVTAEMAREARRCLGIAARCKTVPAFNRWIKNLIEVSPRNAHTVSYFFAKTQNDFSRLLEAEEVLVGAMEVVVMASKGKQQAKRSDKSYHSFADFGIDVRRATDDEITNTVLPMLSERLQSKVRKVWAIDPTSQRTKFDDYCLRSHISDKRLFWHGSANGSWASLVQNSLSLAYASDWGMFGKALYFSDEGTGGRGEKSWGYTSGGYWSRGSRNSACRYMGLFECAYGTPYVVQSCGRYSQSDLDAHNADCIHAYAGCSGLRNEEIMFYRDEAVCMKYLVEFAA